MPNDVTGDANYRGHGALKSCSLILKNVDGSKSIDISSLMIDISIYEDIFAKTLYGVVALKDAINLMNGDMGFPIVGEEFLELTYEINDTPSIFKRFAVNIIKQVNIDKMQKSRTYAIEFCSEEHLIDAVTLVQKSYRQTPISFMAEDILKSYLKVDKELPGPTGNGKKKKTYDIQKTRGNQNIIIPRLTPLEALDFLAKRSIAELGFTSATYLFFENGDGFNFCDIEYLIKRGKDKRAANPATYQYYYQTPNVKNTEGEKLDDSTKFKNIINMVQSHKFDTIEKIKNGYFESSMLVYDFNAKKLTETIYKFLDKYPSMNTLGDGGVNSVSEKSYPENSIDFINKVTKEANTATHNFLDIFHLAKSNPSTDRHSKVFFIPKDSTQPETYLDQIYANRASYMTRFAQNMFTAEVYGDPNIKAGDVILIDLPEIIGTTEAVGKKDKYLSGYFMITTINHKITPDNYLCTYDLFKNGFSTQVITTNNTESVPSADSAAIGAAVNMGIKTHE